MKEYGAYVYTELQAAGFDVLFDDREETPGVKFNDADLIGLPLRADRKPPQHPRGQGRAEAAHRAEQFALEPTATVVAKARQMLGHRPVRRGMVGSEGRALGPAARRTGVGRGGGARGPALRTIAC